MNRLFWDIETSPNIGFFWRPGHKVSLSHDNIIQERAIICICYKWEKENKVHVLKWDDGCDKEICKQFMEVMELADEMVAHNGDRFDMKWFRGRCLKHKLGLPKEVTTIDTLKISRQKFDLNSNRLDYIAKFLLGHGKLHTSFDLWKDIVLNKCDKSMKKMVNYCIKDVKILQEVYEYLSEYSPGKTHVGVMKGLDAWTCPRCGSEDVIRDGSKVSAKGIVTQNMRCKSCGHRYGISQTNNKKLMEHQLNERNKDKDI